MSVLMQLADSYQTSRQVRKVPLPDSCTPADKTFFDHLVDAVVAETPFDAGVTEPAVAIGGSAIVRTSTATVATTTLRPAEESNPLRINISNPSS
jgi:hypothetical protein